MSSSASEYFEIPKFFVFSEKGVFSGSRRDRDFNYKVVPVSPKEGDKCLKAYIWSGEKCLDKSENAVCREFPLSEEGHGQMLSWLEEEFLSRDEVKTPVERRRELYERLTSSHVDLEDALKSKENG